MARRAWLLALLFVGLLGRAQAQQAVITVDHGPNAEAQQSKHYVVLVSLDGFRYDYARKYGAKHLLAIAAHGASVPEGMIPAYPSLTFPNHYTLVTGLYPEHHGIVGNSFYDPARKERYSYTDPKTERGRLLVWRYAAVVACGEAGDAQRVFLLAGIGSGDCRRAADVLSALRQSVSG